MRVISNISIAHVKKRRTLMWFQSIGRNTDPMPEDTTPQAAVAPSAGSIMRGSRAVLRRRCCAVRGRRAGARIGPGKRSAALRGAPEGLKFRARADSMGKEWSF